MTLPPADHEMAKEIERLMMALERIRDYLSSNVATLQLIASEAIK